MEQQSKLVTVLIAIAVALIISAVTLSQYGKHTDAQGPRNRVPVIPESTAVAQKAAADSQQALKDTQAALAQAQQTQRDMQAQLAQLAADAKKEENKPASTVQPVADPCCELGRREVTGVGTVTDFSADLIGGSVNDVYLSFTFSERSGFVKKFFPVCTGQVLPAGRPVVILYNWRAWTHDMVGERGCYQINGFQEQK